MMSASDSWVPGNPVLDFDDREMREALKDSPFVDVIPDRLREARSLFGGDKVERLSES